MREADFLAFWRFCFSVVVVGVFGEVLKPLSVDVVSGCAGLRVKALQFLGVTDGSGSLGKTEHKVLALSGLGVCLVAFGSILDVASTFLPWGWFFGRPAFLPYSFPLFGGEPVVFLANDFYTVAINVMVRLACVLGFAGLLIRGRFKNASSNWVQCVSFGLSFASFAFFYQLDLPPDYGAYLILVAGVLKLVGVVGQNVEIEMVSEAPE